MKSEPKGANRKTKQRDAVQAVFDIAERPLSVAEALERASKDLGGLGVATVYRAINAFLESGRLQAVEIPGEPVRYERADKAHHHHFQCERCARAFDLTGCVENLRKLVPPKFRVRSHQVTLFGLCSSCAS